GHLSLQIGVGAGRHLTAHQNPKTEGFTCDLRRLCAARRQRSSLNAACNCMMRLIFFNWLAGKACQVRAAVRTAKLINEAVCSGFGTTVMLMMAPAHAASPVPVATSGRVQRRGVLPDGFAPVAMATMIRPFDTSLNSSQPRPLPSPGGQVSGMA